MNTRTVKIGNVMIGSGYPVAVQSMCNVPFSRFDELLAQAVELQNAGCDILRVSVPDSESASGFAKLRQKLSIPLVADIHFSPRLALEAMEAGADKIRINPGNMDPQGISDVVRKASEYGIPIRVGVNGGSLEKDLLEKYGAPTAEALSESAYRNVCLLEKLGFSDIVVSMKSSDVSLSVRSARLFREQHPEYPLHIGVTEAGTLKTGLIKNSAGIGALLIDGIGETIRYSLSANPVEEVYAAKSLLRSLGIVKEGIEIVSCPTCGRTTVDSIGLAEKLENMFSDIRAHIRVSVMGCVVNGIGEAGQADIGVTGANGKYIIFRKNGEHAEIIEKNVPENEILQKVEKMIRSLIVEKENLQ